VRLAFRSPLGGMVKRKRLLTFPPSMSLEEVADVVSGASGSKPLWPTSFSAWLQQPDACLLICYSNNSHWDPLPSFSCLKDIKDDHTSDEPIELLFRVLKLSGLPDPMPDVTADGQAVDGQPRQVQKPPLIPQKAKAKAKASTSVVSTKESSGSEAKAKEKGTSVASSKDSSVCAGEAAHCHGLIRL